jgi:anti-sigma factor RsiW
VTTNDPCEKCEEMMQPFIDGVLSDEEVAEAQRHLERCHWCAKRYRFEERLRHYVRVAVSEPMSSELKAKLAALRTPL